jgi:hypothetical protein
MLNMHLVGRFVSLHLLNPSLCFHTVQHKIQHTVQYNVQHTVQNTPQHSKHTVKHKQHTTQNSTTRTTTQVQHTVEHTQHNAPQHSTTHTTTHSTHLYNLTAHYNNQYSLSVYLHTVQLNLSVDGWIILFLLQKLSLDGYLCIVIMKHDKWWMCQFFGPSVLPSVSTMKHATVDCSAVCYSTLL